MVLGNKINRDLRIDVVDNTGVIIAEAISHLGMFNYSLIHDFRTRVYFRVFMVLGAIKL